MSARGAGDFLTRTTAVLGALFVLNSIGLAVLASVDRNPRQIDTSLTAPAAPVPSQLPPVPVTDGGDTSVTSPATADEPAPAPQARPVPLAEYALTKHIPTSIVHPRHPRLPTRHQTH